MGKWGGTEVCPACNGNVYPNNRVYAADRKAFCKQCIKCQVQGCPNELTERTIFKHEGYNFCEKCHETLYDPRFYGVPPGGESIEEGRLRMQREKEDRERRIKEIEEMQKRGPQKDDFELPACMKIAETVAIVGL